MQLLDTFLQTLELARDPVMLDAVLAQTEQANADVSFLMFLSYKMGNSGKQYHVYIVA